MSKTINNLNKSLKDALNLDNYASSSDIGTLSNLQTSNKTNLVGAINEIQNSYASAEYVDVNLKMTSGDLTKLQTENKNNLVSAINELFQSANNGKQLIADAIGEPLDASDTFQAMSDKINDMKSDLKQVLTDEGVSVTEDDMVSLITKVDEEFTKDSNTINDLNTSIENTRSTLASLMQEGGYDITDNEDIDSLLELLALSGLNISEIRQIACSQYHTVILKNDRSVWACGYNNNGQLGLGTSDTNAHSVFTQATTNINNDVAQIACGYYHTVILKNDSSVWGCGNAQYGQLGLGNFNNQSTFTKVTTNVNNDVKRIACGYNHTFISKNDGSIWACGYNNRGQLGLGDTTDRTTFTQVPRGL